MSDAELSHHSNTLDPSRRSWVERVAIVGAGSVGATTAYALLISGTVLEIVLIDRDRKLAEGQVNDLRDAALFSHTTRIVAGDFSHCGTADVIIITADVHQTPGIRSRLDDVKQSASILSDVILEIARHDPCGILRIASNPVDVLTYAAWKWSGLPASRVIGSGTSLDTSRFRRRHGERYGVAPDNVHAYIIGEHGDSQVPVVSSARIAGVPLEEFCREQKQRSDILIIDSVQAGKYLPWTTSESWPAHGGSRARPCGGLPASKRALSHDPCQARRTSAAEEALSFDIELTLNDV